MDRHNPKSSGEIHEYKSNRLLSLDYYANDATSAKMIVSSLESVKASPRKHVNNPVKNAFWSPPTNSSLSPYYLGVPHMLPFPHTFTCRDCFPIACASSRPCLFLPRGVAAREGWGSGGDDNRVLAPKGDVNHRLGCCSSIHDGAALSSHCVLPPAEEVGPTHGTKAENFSNSKLLQAEDFSNSKLQQADV